MSHRHPQHKYTEEYVPPADYPSKGHRYPGHPHEHHAHEYGGEAGIGEQLPLGVAVVQTPTIEPQPWVKDFWNWLSTTTQGSARIDLRRPVPPALDPHKDNLLFTASSRHHEARGHGRAQAIRDQRGVYGYHQDYPATQLPPAAAPASDKQPPRNPSGMRLKITRHVRLLADPEGLTKPWLDLGLGLNLDLDAQALQPVARLKVKDWLSFKLAPEPLVKVAKSLPLPGTGLVVKGLYEVPMYALGRAWQPPARLLLRLESAPGSGVHITPAGIEFAGRTSLGRNLSLIGAAGVSFPRQIPFDMDKPEVGVQVHRLTVKSAW